MLVVACIGLMFNLIQIKILHTGDGHYHLGGDSGSSCGHGHDHDKHDHKHDHGPKHEDNHANGQPCNHVHENNNHSPENKSHTTVSKDIDLEPG